MWAGKKKCLFPLAKLENLKIREVIRVFKRVLSQYWGKNSPRLNIALVLLNKGLNPDTKGVTLSKEFRYKLKKNSLIFIGI